MIGIRFIGKVISCKEMSCQQRKRYVYEIQTGFKNTVSVVAYEKVETHMHVCVMGDDVRTQAVYCDGIMRNITIVHGRVRPATASELGLTDKKLIQGMEFINKIAQ